MKKISALSLAASVYLTTALPAFGATLNICPEDPTQGGTSFFKLCGIDLANDPLGKIINIVFVVAVIIALAFLIYGGIKWIVSGGDKAKVEGARNTIVAALIGLVLVFLAYFILRIVFQLFGLTFSGTFGIENISIFGN